MWQGEVIQKTYQDPNPNFCRLLAPFITNAPPHLWQQRSSNETAIGQQLTLSCKIPTNSIFSILFIPFILSFFPPIFPR